MPVPAKFGLRGVPDIGTPLLEAIGREDAEFAEADEGRPTELGGGCLLDLGTLRTEAIELAEADADEPLACKNKFDLISKNCG